MYAIREITDPRTQPKPFATVESIEAGERFMRDRFNVLVFERDPDQDAADVLATYKDSPDGLPVQFAIERLTYANDGICHNAEPGTFGHECGKPATWIGVDRTGFRSGFCDHCRGHGYEARAIVAWQRAPVAAKH